MTLIILLNDEKFNSLKIPCLGHAVAGRLFAVQAPNSSTLVCLQLCFLVVTNLPNLCVFQATIIVAADDFLNPDWGQNNLRASSAFQRALWALMVVVVPEYTPGSSVPLSRASLVDEGFVLQSIFKQSSQDTLFSSSASIYSPCLFLVYPIFPPHIVFVMY